MHDPKTIGLIEKVTVLFTGIKFGLATVPVGTIVMVWAKELIKRILLKVNNKYLLK
jgi:hypothetical protein